MKVCICRVDNRLVHGQITTVWVRRLEISSILVVDNLLSHDSLASRVLCMAAPPKVEIQVLSVAQMAAALQSETGREQQVKAMILFRDLETVYELFAQTGKIADTLSLGGMPSRIGRHELGQNLFFTREERRLALDLIDQYCISIVSQVLPSDVPIDVGALLRENNGK